MCRQTDIVVHREVTLLKIRFTRQKIAANCNNNKIPCPLPNNDDAYASACLQYRLPILLLVFHRSLQYAVHFFESAKITDWLHMYIVYFESKDKIGSILYLLFTLFVLIYDFILYLKIPPLPLAKIMFLPLI